MERMEQWKDIENSPLYEVSTFGNVRHKTRKNVLNPRASKKKYNYICYDVYIADVIGKQRNQKVHQLVAKAFIPNPNNYTEIDHIDRNTANNRVENLRWVNRSENCRNTKVRSDNTSGERGIYKPAGRDKFVLRIGEKHIGCYDTLEEAVADRERFEKGEIEAPVQEGVLKEKYIYIDDGKYKVEIQNKTIQYRKRFNTLEEAIAVRNTLISQSSS